jgi:hypothetical protein
MPEIKLIVHWTKRGDAEKLTREKIWSVETPLKGSPTVAAELLLHLPSPPAGTPSATYEIEVEEEREEITEEELPTFVAFLCTTPEELKERREKEAAQKREAEKAAYIASWSSQHGSARLQKQLALGYSGWPLYLHERLAFDFFPLAPLVPAIDNARGTHEMTVNPTEAQLEAEEQVARHLVELGLAADLPSACQSTRIAQGGKPSPGVNVKEKAFFVLCEAYHPGPRELFEKPYEIVFPLEPTMEMVSP